MVFAFADNDTLIQDDDLFGVLDRGNALGHDHQGAGAGMLLERLAQRCIGLIVQG